MYIHDKSITLILLLRIDMHPVAQYLVICVTLVYEPYLVDVKNILLGMFFFLNERCIAQMQ